MREIMLQYWSVVRRFLTYNRHVSALVIFAALCVCLVSFDAAVAAPISDAAQNTEQELTATESEVTQAAAPVATSNADVPPRSPAAMRVGGSKNYTYADIAAIIDREAKLAGIPAEIAEAVTHTESGFNTGVIGADGEIGLMQVMPPTARMMGFSGSLAELAVPETNIRLGITYLAQAWFKAGGDLCTAVMKYRAGHGETRFSHLSVNYCLRVRARLASRGFKVAGVVPVATFGSALGSAGIGGGAGRCRGRCLAGSTGGSNLVALNDKLSQIAFRVTVMKVPMR